MLLFCLLMEVYDKNYCILYFTGHKSAVFNAITLALMDAGI